MNEELVKVGKSILRVLNANGFEAYLIDDIVKANFANTQVTEARVCTDAKIDVLKQIFASQTLFEKGNDLYIQINGFTFIISPFTKNPKNKILGLHYSKALLHDLACRDYTFNAIIMTHSGNTKDFYHGINDAKHKTIRTISNPIRVIKASPIRILKAFRYMGLDGFRMASRLKSAIRLKASMIKQANQEDIDKEIHTIYTSKNAKKAIRRMNRYGVSAYIPFYQKVLENYMPRHADLSYDEFLAMCCILNEELDKSRLEYVANIEKFKVIYNVAVTNPKCKFDTLTLYSSGADVLTSVWKINRVLKRTNVKLKKIMEAYNALPIHKTCDLAFKGEDILKASDGLPAEQMLMIVDEITFKVLNGELSNKYEELKAYVLKEVLIQKEASIPIISASEIDDDENKINILKNMGLIGENDHLSEEELAKIINDYLKKEVSNEN